jgi:hypothetical protein
MNIIYKRILTTTIFGMLIGLVPTRSVVTTQAFSTDLFMRSVFHSGTSNNMIELFNGTGASVNLADYHIDSHHNGLTKRTGTFRLPNVNLPNANAYLIYTNTNATGVTDAHRAYVNNFPLKVLSTDSAGYASAQGANDVFILRKGTSTELDIFGMFEYNPTSGTGWTEVGTTLKYGFVESTVTVASNFQKTLVRRPTVINPQISSYTYKTVTSIKSFQPSEWGVYPNGTLPSSVYRFNLFDNVTDVIALITAIANPVVISSGPSITSARAAYDALTASQKTMVTNYSTLTDAENAFAGFTRIAAVYDLIQALPIPVTLANETAVNEARTAFNALSESEQLQVTNANKLVEAETLINNLKVTNPIVAAIAALPTPVTLSNANEVTSIRNLYDALTLDQKALVSNYNTLTNAELLIAKINRINNVQALIAALPIPVTLANATAIAAARTAYNALIESEQADVNNLTVLVNAENHLLNLQAANQVQLRIAALSNPITLADETEVSETRQAYSALTLTQRELVTNEANLISAETVIEGLLDEIDDVIFAIQGIPDPVTILSQTQLETIRDDFDALSALQQARVTNRADLVTAETEMLAILARIQNVITLINGLVDPITLAQEQAFLTAQTAFNLLSGDEKTFVTNRQRLVLVGDTILDLNTPRYVVYYIIFNSIFTELVKSGTKVLSIPTNPTRLGFTFTGWSIEGTSTIVNLSTYIISNVTRLVAQFIINPNDNQSELIVDVVGLDDINITTIYPFADIALELKVETIPIPEANVNDLGKIETFVEDDEIFSFSNIFILDLEIEVTYTNNGQRVTETLDNLDEPIEIEIKIPTLYQDYASYQVVRVHEGVASYLDTTYEPITNTLTFETDRFSTYGVMYSNALVDDLIGLISAIPQPPTLADKSSIEAIRAAYDALTPTQQAMITNLQLLINAEAVIAQLMLDINLVIATIDDFPSLNAITLSDEAEIVAARTAYDALTPAQQALVSNYQELLDAEAKIAALKQAVIDEAAANVVIEMIDEFPALNAITLSDEAEIVAARTAYDALTPAQQALVSNYQELLDAEAKIAALKQAVIDEAAANVVIEMIDEFPALNTITLSDEAEIVAARTAYDALTPAQQALVSNYQELLDAEAKIAQLKLEISLVIDMIDDFPSLNAITLSDEAEIVAARTAYDALTPAQQALVSNYQELVAAEAKIADLKLAANVVDEMIDEFPALNAITLSDEAEIVAARTAYDGLTPAQQALVSNYQELLDAEAKIAELKAIVSPSDLFSLLPFHLLSGAIILIGFYLKKRKKAQ